MRLDKFTGPDRWGPKCQAEQVVFISGYWGKPKASEEVRIKFGL